MILELVLINQETGEPIYHTAMKAEDATAAELQGHATAMLLKLGTYKARNIAPRAHQLFTTAAAEQAHDVVDDLGDLNGPVNMGY